VVTGLKKALRFLFLRLVRCLVRLGRWPIYLVYSPTDIQYISTRIAGAKEIFHCRVATARWGISAL
jgi:hypothetical protein